MMLSILWDRSVSVAVIIVAAVLLLLIVTMILVFRDVSRIRKEKEQILEETPWETEPQKTEIRATVVDVQVGTKWEGIRIPRAVEEYRVFFEDDWGNPFSLEVPKEYFDGFTVGLKGILVMVNDTLYGFTPDSDGE